jgi:multiple sugar transport system permease protein
MPVERRSRTTFLFLLPWIFTFLVFDLLPLVFSFAVSFTDYNPLRAGLPALVGLDNYAGLFRDPLFWKSLRNTVFFVVWTIPFTTAIAFLLALALDRKFPLRDLFRAGFFTPSVLSLAVIALVFQQLYSPFGALNAFLHAIGMEGTAWLRNPATALPAIMAMDVWASVGYYMVIYLAGLQSIPRELHEAAALEGTGYWTRQFRITIPLLAPVTLFVLVINTIRSFQVFVEVFVMTQGGPLHSTLTSVYYLYDLAFYRFRMGYANALAYLLFSLMIVLSLLEAKALRRREP